MVLLQSARGAYMDNPGTMIPDEVQNILDTKIQDIDHDSAYMLLVYNIVAIAVANGYPVTRASGPKKSSPHMCMIHFHQSITNGYSCVDYVVSSDCLQTFIIFRYDGWAQRGEVKLAKIKSFKQVFIKPLDPDIQAKINEIFTQSKT